MSDALTAIIASAGGALLGWALVALTWEVARRRFQGGAAPPKKGEDA